MDNTNYNIKNVNIQDYVKKNITLRKHHIDNNDECIHYKLKSDGNPYTLGAQSYNATKNLFIYLGIQRQRLSWNVATCHTCINDTSAPNGFICINPKHLYFGSKSENYFDMPDEKMSAIKSKQSIAGTESVISGQLKEARKKSHNSKKHNSRQTNTCPHCSKTITGLNYFRYHGDNCKHKR